VDKWEERRLLVKIARMYYEDEMTQSEIAAKTGIYRTTIGRMLKKARDMGIVTITIHSDFDRLFDLENRLEKRFGLREAIIVPSTLKQSRSEKKSAIGRAGADFLKRIVKDGDVVGLAWGTTLAAMIHSFSECPKRNADFVPLVGGPGNLDSKYHVNTIVYTIANAFRGTAHFIDAAAIVEKVETKEEIVRSHYFKKILELWERLTIAVVGIGAPISSSNLIWTGFFGDKEIEELNKLNAIGDICSRYFDPKGNILHPEVSKRTIAIGLYRLKKLEYSVGMAESVEKVPSIIGAMRGGFINVLITNEETAEAILKR
jgi:DNA-binding transcriptional regulator LsrR (DeoR family)